MPEIETFERAKVVGCLDRIVGFRKVPVGRGGVVVHLVFGVGVSVVPKDPQRVFAGQQALAGDFLGVVHAGRPRHQFPLVVEEFQVEVTFLVVELNAHEMAGTTGGGQFEVVPVLVASLVDREGDVVDGSMTNNNPQLGGFGKRVVGLERVRGTEKSPVFEFFDDHGAVVVQRTATVHVARSGSGDTPLKSPADRPSPKKSRIKQHRRHLLDYRIAGASSDTSWCFVRPGR